MNLELICLFIASSYFGFKCATAPFEELDADFVYYRLISMASILFLFTILFLQAWNGDY
jgi:hypothetical protein